MSIEVFRRIQVRATLEPDFRKCLMKSPLQFLQDYDLTDEEKRRIILPHFQWFVENRLAAFSYPASDDALSLLYSRGIRVLLTLSEAPLPAKSVHNAGLLAVHMPIVGFTAPTLPQVNQCLALISSCLDRNLPVGIHCVAGLGRTGTILACSLVQQGMSASKAIVTLREWRPGSLEVPEQEAVVYEYEQTESSINAAQ